MWPGRKGPRPHRLPERDMARSLYFPTGESRGKIQTWLVFGCGREDRAVDVALGLLTGGVRFWFPWCSCGCRCICKILVLHLARTAFCKNGPDLKTLALSNVSCALSYYIDFHICYMLPALY